MNLSGNYTSRGPSPYRPNEVIEKKMNNLRKNY